MEAIVATAALAMKGTSEREASPMHAEDRPARKINVNQRERVVSALLGGALLTRSITRPSLPGVATALIGGGLLYRGIRGHSYLYQTLGMSTATRNGQSQDRTFAGPSSVKRSITIGKATDDLYRFWREPQNLARIMGHFAEVTSTSEGRTHWQVRGPLGRSLEWDTQVVEDRPVELLRWESLTGATLPNQGSVSFRPAPGDRGTEVTLQFRFDPPGGAIGDAALKLFGLVPGVLADKALRRFKSLSETGEIPTIEHNPSARANGSGN